MTIQVKAHPVTATKIVNVQPLISNGQMRSPEEGLTLMLDNGVRYKWLAEKDGAAPATGDWLVHDDELHTVFIVVGARFSTMFEESRP